MRTNHIVLIALLIYGSLCSTALWTRTHYATNLEPYPDGLFYLVHAQNLAQGHGMTLARPGLAEQPLAARILPTYPLVLSLPRFAGFGVLSFYVMNVALGMATIVLLSMLLIVLQVSNTTRALALGLYLSHASLYFFVATPMAENLALLLITCLLLAYAKIQQRDRLPRQAQLLLAGCLMSLALTKYTTVPIAVAGWAIALVWLGKRGQLRDMIIPSAGLGLGILGVVLFYRAQHQSVSELQQFFSFSLLAKNALAYALSTVGLPIPLLWHRVALTTLGIVAVLYWTLPSKLPLRWQTLLLSLAHAPLILSFYAVDGRYLITLLPILVTVFALVHQHHLRLLAKPTFLHAGFFGLIYLAQLATQIPLGKVILGSNWLNRSQGWQYQAAVQTSAALSTQPSGYLISALPPYLYDLYGLRSFTILPLSHHQEFADKYQQAWSDFNVQQPFIEQYRKLLAQGKRLFVSNAYLTSNHEQQADYELLSHSFTLRPVAQGCLNTCDTFELILP